MVLVLLQPTFDNLPLLEIILLLEMVLDADIFSP